MKREAAEARGRWAEARAADYLRREGWQILGQRLRTPAGEVDIVARKGRTLAFVEVKARGSAAALDLALDRRRLVRVAGAAEILLPRFARADDDIRIDAILIGPGGLPRHLEHVWQG